MLRACKVADKIGTMSKMYGLFDGTKVVLIYRDNRRGALMYLLDLLIQSKYLGEDD